MSKSTYEKLTQLKMRLSPPNKPATLRELADYMGRDQRTIYRYIETLESENCGLKQEKKTKKFFIQASAAKRPEAIIRGLKSAQKVLDSVGTTAHGKNVKKAIEYLCGDENADSETMSHAMSVDNDFIVDLGPFSEYSENLSFREAEIDKMLEAIKSRAKLFITYVPAKDLAQEEKLEVCPLKLVLRIDTLYLIALSESVVKFFAVRRIKNFRRTGGFFPPVDFDYRNLYRNCFGKFSGAAFEKIRLVMEIKSSWLAAQFREAHFNPPAKIRKQEPMTVELSVYDTPDLEGWLLSVLPDVKILEPESLKVNLRKKLKESVKAL